MTAPVLRATGLSKAYRRGPEVVHAVDGVSADFPAGRVTLIVGPSGSGKTTLLNLLAGWEAPQSGTVLWDGRPRDPATLGWSDMAVIPQRIGLLEELSVQENVSLADRITGTASEAATVLDGLGLGELLDALPDELSQGQQQRVAVARAIAAKPRVLVVDEPTSSQDEANARVVLSALRDAAAAGAACIVASHDSVAPEYADVVLAMRDGCIEP